jgi:hypothetical protein
MKRYVSLAGALLVGSVVTKERKTALKQISEAQATSIVK